MEPATAPEKTSALSKVVGTAGGVVIGGYTAMRYVRSRLAENLRQTFWPKDFKPSQSLLKHENDIKLAVLDPESVLGKAYYKTLTSTEGHALLNTARASTAVQTREVIQEAERKFTDMVAREVPFLERLTMKNLQFTAGQKTKAALAFAAVGSITGYAAYKVASWMTPEDNQQQR